MAFYDFIVENLESPIRVDKYIALLQIENFSRSRLKSGMNAIIINGRNGKLSSKVNNSDVVHIEWKDPVPTGIIPENLPLSIMYEDENVTVINKKQGMVTHPGCGNWSGTLVNALFHHWGEQCTKNFSEDSLEQLRPGIVHRLDKDTSGAIITAKNKNAELWLQKQFKDHRVKKEYIAIVHGHLPNLHGSIKTQIVRDPKNRKKFIATDDKSKGKFSHTVYRCVQVYGPYSLVRLRLKTGRTHQIRVHLKYLGCPILGDPIYGKKDALFDSATLMLHAKKLSIRLPFSEEFKEFESPTPIRFKKVMQKLQKDFKKLLHSSKKQG